MGFRCPKCKKDFDTDREALFKHLQEEKDCGREALGIYADRLKDSSSISNTDNIYKG